VKAKLLTDAEEAIQRKQVQALPLYLTVSVWLNVACEHAHAVKR
jgi:hypothetical protein